MRIPSVMLRKFLNGKVRPYLTLEGDQLLLIVLAMPSDGSEHFAQPVRYPFCLLSCGLVCFGNLESIA